MWTCPQDEAVGLKNVKERKVVIIICTEERRKRYNGDNGVQAIEAQRLRADDDTLAAGSLLLVDVLILRRAVRRVIGVSAAGTTAVKLDAVTGARNTIAFTRTA
jgi:hypothetical protein